MACGFAATYPQLVVARMTVGFGEAGGVPPSYALITDTVSARSRGTAFGIYNLGAVDRRRARHRLRRVDRGGVRLALRLHRDRRRRDLITAAAVRLFVREPARGRFDARADATVAKAGFGETLRVFFSRKTLVLAALGSGATQIITYGLGNFTTLFLMREKGMTLKRGRGLVRARRRHRHGRGDGRLRARDRPADEAIAASPTPRCRRSRSRSRCPSTSPSSGRRPGSSRWSS